MDESQRKRDGRFGKEGGRKRAGGDRSQEEGGGGGGGGGLKTFCFV